MMIPTSLKLIFNHQNEPRGLEGIEKKKKIEETHHGIKRRNSTGTIYIGTTMSQQDNEATIKSVCAVIRAHMMEAAREGIEPLKDYDIFLDAAYTKADHESAKLSSPQMEEKKVH